jgi:transposase
MTQPLIAAAMGVSLSTVNRAHTAYDHGGIEELKPRPSGGRKHENMALEEEKALLARFAKARVSRARGQRKDFSQSTSQSATSTIQRHLISARTHRAFRASAMQTWHEVVP